MNGMEWYVLLCAIIVILLVLLLFARRKNSRTNHNINFMLNSLDSGDYAFSFRTENVSNHEKGINQSLNLISNILKRARNEAIEREKFYELIINSVRTGILVVDDGEHILRTNDSAKMLIGLQILTHTEQVERVSPELRLKINNIKAGERQQATLQDERGTTSLQLQASETTLKGEHVRIIAINDINSELDQNEIDSWTKLIRVLTHEIMNTVAPITSLSETLLAKAAEDGAKEMHDGLEVIQKTSRELIEFVENYRKFTHLPTPSPTLFYVKPFVERCVQMAQQIVMDSEIKLVCDIKPADLILYADESLVAHVVNNLLKNAIQAIQHSDKCSGNVWIEARTNTEEAVIIDVSNDGPIIPDDVAQHIFVPFFTTKKDGSGIGLSISRQIMRLSGGSLTLRTDRKRGITTFELLFN